MEDDHQYEGLGFAGDVVSGATTMVTSIVGEAVGGAAFRRQHRQAIADRRVAGQVAHAQAAQQAMGRLRTQMPWTTIAVAGGGLVILGGVLVYLIRAKKRK